MKWSEVSPRFAYDGSLRDVYIHDCNINDWISVWNIVSSDPDNLTFIIDGVLRTPPLDVAEALALRGHRSVSACYVIGGLRLKCHFFNREEIEFDLDPREINSPTSLGQLEQFLTALGLATSKKVRLTYESQPESMITCFVPEVGRIVWS
ncbi:hypothetical protein ABHV46_01305 [Asaia sp. BMEF1]|uniref:hypothetical protein n=1 Tax=Asaia sp. BMEF1 TaxID=3155932 RepID=UPI003F676A13